MISLYDYIESIYKQLPQLSALDKSSLDIIATTSFENLINNDKKCLELISSILEFRSEITSINSQRASHIIITWLLGIGLDTFFKLNKDAVGFHDLFATSLWLQSSILHDYGYFCNETNKVLPLNEITQEHDLFTDFYDDIYLNCLNGMSSKQEYERYFSYTYDEIKSYYLYSQTYHKSDKKAFNNELSDHGIVGACIAFRKYCRNIKNIKNKYNHSPSDVLTRIRKIACIIAASHNIFKSTKATDDDYIKYGLKFLTSDSPIRVTRRNNLLLLLSLVDTIECTKRFSKKNNPKQYLIQSTTLKQVDIDLDSDKLNINFDRLSAYLKEERRSKEMSAELKKHINAISDMGSWTDFCANISDNNINSVYIKLKDTV